MKSDSVNTLLILLVIVLIFYYSANAITSPEGSMKKYVYKKKQLGSVVGNHGGLVVSSPEVNIRTRGPEMNYQMQGILYKEDSESNGPKHLALYGRQTYPGSNKWEYMVGDKSLDDLKIPIGEKRQELQDDDQVDVKGFGEGYKVQLYPNDELKYLPY